MKTLHRLFVSPRPITEKMREQRERVAEFLSIPGRLEIKVEFKTIPGVLDKLRLEGKDDLDEHSIREAIGKPDYLNVHLILTGNEWKQLGLRSTLYGQSQEIDGQIVTYARGGNRNILRKHKENGVQKHLTEIDLVEWHELDHGIRALFNIDPTSTHYHFYGWAEKYKNMPKREQNAISPRRYVRKPDPLAAWHDIPWERLPLDRVQVKRTLLEKIVELATLLLNQIVTKRVNEEKEILSGLQPLVARKAEQLIIAMARKGHAIDIVSGFRSFAEQNKLYAQGRTTPGSIVTNARGGESLHNYGVAFDAVFMVGGKPSWAEKHPWTLLGETAEAIGLEWGGRWTSFKDRPHMQLTLDYNLDDFKNKRVKYSRYR